MSKKSIPVNNKTIIAKEPKPILKEEKVSGGGLLNIIKGKELYLLLGAIAIACGIVFHDFITFEKVYLFKDIGSDSLNIYFPGIAHLSDYIKSYGIPGWTFSQGLGQNIFPFSLGDIFSDIIILLFSKEQLPYTLAIVEVIKIFLCGFVFFKYLLQLKIDPFAACITSFLFAFSGYIILGGCWTIFSTEALYVTIILYGFERWLNDGKWLWFVLGITLMSIMQPFFLFPYALFLAAYIPVRFNDVHQGGWKKFPVFLFKTIGLSVLAVAISAWQLFPDLLQYIESPRVGGESRLIDNLRSQPIFTVADDLLRFTTIFRSFNTDMLGTGSAYHGWQNYLEAPLFYCGVLCLVVFPQAFFGMNKSQKIAYGIFAGLFALPIFFPYFRYAFWAFTGDYFRTYSFVVSLLLLIFSAKALHHILTTGKVNFIALGLTLVFLLFLLFNPNEQWAPLINTAVRSVAALMVFVYAALLLGISRKGDVRNISTFLLFVVCFIEMIYSSSNTVNDRDVMTHTELKEKVGYNDYTVDAINFLKANDKSFYRVNKDYSSGLAIHASINDAKVQGYYGVSSYYSFNQKNYIKFLGDLDVIDTKVENATRWAMGLGRRPLLLSVVGVKYWLSKQAISPVQSFGYDSVARFGDVRIYRNRYVLPLGYTYNQVMDEATFKKLSLFSKDLFFLRGCVVANEDKDLLTSFRNFNLADTAVPFSLAVYDQFVAGLRKDTFAIRQFDENHITGTTNAGEPKILYFSIPLDEGWKATVNGKEAKIYRVNCGFIGLKLNAGKNEIDLKFEPRYVKQGAIVSILSLIIFAGLLSIGILNKKKGDILTTK